MPTTAAQSFASLLYKRLEAYKTIHGAISQRIWLEEAAMEWDRYGQAVKKSKRQESAAEWLDSLCAEPGYAGINVRFELGACERWCKAKDATFSRPRFVKWLERAARDLAGLPRDKAPLNGHAIHNKTTPEPLNWRDKLDDSLKWAAARDWASLPEGVQKVITRVAG